MTYILKNLSLILLALLLGSCSLTRGLVEQEETVSKTETTKVSERDQLKSTALLIDASREKTLGNYARAYQLYIEATKQDPFNDAAYFELAKLYIREGDQNKGIKHAKKATELDPGNPYYQILLADIYILRDEVDEARRIYEQLAYSEPDNLDFQDKLLSVYIYDQKYETALQLINHIEQIMGFSQKYSIKKQQLFLELERYDDAIEEAEKMIGFFPEESIFYEFLGELYIKTGRPDKARDVYLRLREVDHDGFLAYLLLADLYISQDDIKEAFSYLDIVFYHPELGMETKSRILITFLFYSDDENDYLEKAIDMARWLVTEHDNDAEAFFIYGDILIRAGQPEKARDAYFRGAKLDPSDILVWQQLLGLSLSLREYDIMLKHSELALEYFFEQPVLFLYNGLANMQLKKYEPAAASLEYGLSITIDNKDLRMDFATMLGDVYHFLGAYNESDSFYEKALSYDPNNATALNNYSYHLSVRGERLKEALQMSEQANNLEPNNSAFQDTYGWIKYKLGNYEEAEKWIRKAIENAEEPSGVILEHYGDVMYQLRNTEKALEYWQKASETGDGSDLLDKKIRNHTLYE